MLQSKMPQHVAIIMDGNGRWAQARGLPRIAGHGKGAEAAEQAVEAAAEAQIACLTLYAFSSDNWRRPHEEVSALMGLFARQLRAQRARSASNGVQVRVIGRRDRLPDAVLREIEDLEAATAAGAGMRLNLAIDYSSREAISEAARAARHVTREAIGHYLATDVDLLIRTGGEQRLSDFLMWESAYAELVFVPTLWPDFQRADLRAAVRAFQRRQRRFGGAGDPAPLGQLWTRNADRSVHHLRGDRWLR